jgi:aminopeptidase N
MKTDAAQVKYLKDYKKPTHLISKVDLTFELDNTKTKVTNIMQVKFNESTELVLNGEELELISIHVNGNKLSEDSYKIIGHHLTISNLPKEDFTLEISNYINPEANTALDGLYKSGGIFCTQNEPEGFRRITYFIDRPDVLSIYTTKIIADKKTNPVLLSNGNLIESGDLDNGKHFAVWNDPFPKPAYLYALVAGDLGLVQDSYTTGSGREIDLRIYVDKGNESKCHHAMESLKNSMKWDEERFRLEYDLDIYMIVAVDSFNMGAMENKGLNIFNSAYVLADRETATDDNFYGIESVIGHEYFHNWTGNRITCRDWFQLTLKEGLTVFRDQEFSADLNSRAVCRISDVKGLRGHQFTKDAGPTAHPIKPKSYIEMNNFYTSTVYEKGSEVIRMIHTLLGEEGFQKGMDKYFELFDGQAVTTEDFIHAMSIANNNYDFSQFSLWYDQSGTPELDVNFSQDGNEAKLVVKQSCPATPGQDQKEPFHMPLALGLVDENGNDIKLELTNRDDQKDLERGVLHLKNEVEEFKFTNVTSKVVPSLNRDFSTPVRMKTNLSSNDLSFLMANDSNEFNRFESCNVYAKEILLKMTNKKSQVVDEQFVVGWGEILADKNIDDAFKALCLGLPTIGELLQEQEIHDYEATKNALDFLEKTLADTYKAQLQELYNTLNVEEEFKVDAKSMGKRALKNKLLMYLSLNNNELAGKQYDSATNMTDMLAALSNIVENSHNEEKDYLNKFYERFKDQTLVMQKWLGVQASSSKDETFENVQNLLNSDEYDAKYEEEKKWHGW